MSPSSTRQAAPAETPAEGRQKAKSDAMRRRICEAAAASLSEAGYHRTSIIMVVKRAGISSGALQHHFPSKLDLVVATAEHLLNRSVKWLARAMGEAGGGVEAYADIIRRSWREQIRTSDYGALLEIMIAARTDAALKERLRPALKQWRDAIEEELATLLPGELDKQTLTTVLTISRCLMTGILVHDGLLGEDARMHRTIEDWLGFVSGQA